MNKLPWDYVPEEARSEWRDSPATVAFLNSLLPLARAKEHEVSMLVAGGSKELHMYVEAGVVRGLEWAHRLATEKGPTNESSK